ncbi:MAG: hypothetical protein LBQ87_03280, partial [Candidatus Fibromonas sp.]|nr:hypothetical protein [Candidatus Fibromonas sp.]
MASFLSKIKSLILVLAVFACYAFAGNGNINFYGQRGVHKTQSAQTLGHGVFGLGLFFEGAGLDEMIGGKVCWANPNDCYEPSTFMGLNSYPFLSLGLSDYFDFSISVPIYGELFTISDEKSPTDNLHNGGWGDVHVSTKIRAPFNDDFPLDLALMLGAFFGNGKTTDYGFWIHDPAFLNLQNLDSSYSYTNENVRLKIGAAVTFDFNRMRVGIPLMIHLNGAYRM